MAELAAAAKGGAMADIGQTTEEAQNYIDGELKCTYCGQPKDGGRQKKAFCQDCEEGLAEFTYQIFQKQDTD